MKLTWKWKGIWIGLAGLLFILGLKLSYWQYSRAQEKIKLDILFNTNRQQAAILIQEFRQTDLPKKFSKIKVLGQYLRKPVLLLDNQMQENKPGYLVFFPFQIQNTNQVILINHGWIEKNTVKNTDKNISLNLNILDQDTILLTGLVEQPSSGLLLKSKYWAILDSESDQDNRWVIQTLNWEKIRQLFISETVQKTVIPIVLNIDPSFKPKFGLSSGQHYNYAVQWLLLSGLLLGYLSYFLWPRRS